MTEAAALKERRIKADIGPSAATIYTHFTGTPLMEKRRRAPDYPYDANEFRQCVELVNSSPAWRERLYELAAISVQWRAIVKHWDSLEQATHARGWNASSLVRGAINNEIRSEMLQSPSYAKVEAVANAILAGQQNVQQASYQLNAQDTLLLANMLGDTLHRQGRDDYHVAVSESREGMTSIVAVVAARPFGKDRKDYLLLHTLDEFPLRGRDGIEIAMAGPGKTHDKAEQEEETGDPMVIRFAASAA